MSDIASCTTRLIPPAATAAHRRRRPAAVIAPDWLPALRAVGRDSALFRRWFDAAPALPLLRALAGHLSSVEPASPRRGGRRVAAPVSADAAAELLAERFAAVESPGIADVLAAALVPGGGASAESAAALLASLPDRAAAAPDVAALQPAAFVPLAVAQLVALAGDAPRAEFAADVLGHLALRGHAALAARALWRAASCASAAPTAAAVLAAVPDSPAFERLLEAAVWALGKEEGEEGEAANASGDAYRAGLAALVPPATWAARADARLLLGDKLLTARAPPPAAREALLDFLAAQAGAAGVGAGAALADAAWRVAAAWGAKAAVRTLPAPRQAALTAALVGALARLDRASVDGHPRLLPAILEGVGARLDSPLEAPRRQAMRVGRALSAVLSPDQPPLFGEEDMSPLPEELERAPPPRALGAAARGGAKRAPGARRRARRAGADTGANADADADADGGPLTETDSDDGGAAAAPAAAAATAASASSDSEFSAYSGSESGEEDLEKCELQLRDVAAALRRGEGDDWKGQARALRHAEALVRAAPDELPLYAAGLARALLTANVPRWLDEEVGGGGGGGGGAGDAAGQAPAEARRFRGLVALAAGAPEEAGLALAEEFYSPSLDTAQRALALGALGAAAREVAAPGSYLGALPGIADARGGAPGRLGGPGDGPAAASAAPAGRLVRASERSLAAGRAAARAPAPRANRFPPVALRWAAALLRHCDERRQGVDLFGRDAFLLGRLLATLAAFLEEAGGSAEAGALGAAVLELVRGAGVHDSPEPFVRRAALAAAARVLGAVPPGRLAGAMLPPAAGAGEEPLAERVRWVAGWAAAAAAGDPDEGCRAMASACQRMQAELAAGALAALRAGDGFGDGFGAAGVRVALPPTRAANFLP